MRRVKKTACILLLITPFLGAAPLQKITGKPASGDQESKSFGQEVPVTLASNQRKALAQLDQLLNLSKTFEDAEIRIRIQAHIADLLWVRDEPRARVLFEEAFRAISSVKLPPQDKSMPPSYVGSDSHYPLRSDLVRLVSPRDPSLAAKLVDSVVDQPPNVDPKFLGSGYGSYSERDMLQFQFGQSITNSD